MSFQEGNKLGTGRLPAAKEIEYVHAAKRAITPEKFGEMCQALYERVLLKRDAKAFDVLRKVFVAEVARQEQGGIGEAEAYMSRAREAMGLAPLDPNVESEVADAMGEDAPG